MSQNNDLLGLFSSPPPTAQAPQQANPFGGMTMAAPPAPMAANPLSGGFQSGSNPMSPFSTTSQSGSAMGAFAANSNQGSSSAISAGQFSGLFSSEPVAPTSQNQSSAFGGVMSPSSSQQRTSSPFGQQPQTQSVFGQGGNTGSVFGGGSSQSTSVFDQVDQSTSVFDQVDKSTSVFDQVDKSTSVFGGSNQSSTSVFGGANQDTSVFGGAQQNTSVFGQTDQNKSVFGGASQSSSVFGGANQSTSVFGGQADQSTSVFGGSNQNASLFGGANQQNASGFAQTSQNNASSFGQSNQRTSSPFSSAGQQKFSAFGQMPSTGQSTTGQTSPFGQTSQQFSPSPFGAFPSPSPAAGVSQPQGGTNLGQNFGSLSSMSPNPANNSAGGTGAVFAAFPVASNTPNNMANLGPNVGTDIPFGNSPAFTSPANKPAAATTTPGLVSSSTALDDPFFNAFSQSTTITSPKPDPTTNTASSPFDIFSSPTSPVSIGNMSSNTVNSSGADTSFDPFGLGSPTNTNNTPASKQETPAAAEPLFDAFSSAPPAASPAKFSTGFPDAPATSAEIESETPEADEEEEESEEEELNNSETVVESSESVGEQEQITDPVLKEINERFGGRWKLVRSDPYDEFLKTLGIGLVYRKRAGKGTPEQAIEVKDGRIHINIRSTFHSQTYVFTLNEETENLVEKVPQSVFCNYSNGKLFLQMTPADNSFGKTQAVERFINDIGEQVVIHSAGIASCRRYFARLDQQKPTTATTKATSPTTPTTPTTPVATDLKTTGSNPSIQDTKPVPKTPAIAKPEPAPTQTSGADATNIKSPVAQPASASQLFTFEEAPPAAAAKKVTFGFEESNSSPSVPAQITPGQLLLQNLQEISPEQIDDGGQKLVFGDESDDVESEA